MKKIRTFEYEIELIEKYFEKICSDVDPQIAKEMFLTFPLALISFSDVFTGGGVV